MIVRLLTTHFAVASEKYHPIQAGAVPILHVMSKDLAKEYGVIAPEGTGYKFVDADPDSKMPDGWAEDIKWLLWYVGQLKAV